jgi:hypothetical protein
MEAEASIYAGAEGPLLDCRRCHTVAIAHLRSLRDRRGLTQLFLQTNYTGSFVRMMRSY